MRKPATALTVAAVLAGIVSADSVETTLNGQPLRFDQPARLQEGRVMVPLRGIFESLGAEVLFDPSTRSIKATREGRVVELSLGSQLARVNGQPTYLDVPAASLGGRTMVPLRFVSEALGAEVRWQPSLRTVALSSVPLPSTPDPDTPLRLESVLHNGQKTLRPGDQLVVTATGEPGGQARFDILGLTSAVPMHEVKSGHYEGRWLLPQHLKTMRAPLVVHLQHGDRAASLQATQSLSFQALTPVSINPPEGSLVATSRPTIHADWAVPIQVGTARVFLDGQEVSPQARVVGSAVHFVPNDDLMPGSHRVMLQALDHQGKLLSREWSFSVPNQVGHSPGYGLPPIVLSNLSNGSRLPARYNIQGQTTPFAQVLLQAQAQNSLIPGWIGLERQVDRAQVQADAAGRFNLPLNISSVPGNTPVELEIQVRDSNGRTTETTRVQVTRI